MAANDPSFDVATPRGVLQGVAVFNWDGSQWQPTGRAATEVATPTGVLRGVAAFTGGPNWSPVTRAQTEVPTPSGVLDGVAVYTWSGSQWVPSSGNIETATPSGVLQGVAAFDWDGTTWQPAAQAGAEVPTPYGVLTGVARFGWTGSAWAAVGAPSLSLDFMTPGQLDSRIVFTRASSATYTDASGVIQTAATNAPRWDYKAGVLQGLLIEEQRTNNLLWSTDLTDAAWVVYNGATKGSKVTGPDGTLSGMTVNFVPASQLYQSIIVGPGTLLSVYARAGSLNQLQLGYSDGTLSPVFNLTAQWQRFSLVGPASASNIAFNRVGPVTGTIQLAMPSLETGAFPTSYIPTTSAAVTRARDVTKMPPNVSWYTAPGGSWFAEFICNNNPTNGLAIRVLANSLNNGFTQMFVNGNAGRAIGMYDGAAELDTANGITIGAISKAATTWATGQAKACANGGAIATLATLTNGYPLDAAGILILVSAAPSDSMTGYIRRLNYWPRVLSDTEMQQVTT